MRARRFCLQALIVLLPALLASLAFSQEVRVLKGHGYSVAFSPDGRLLASGSWDDTIRLWEVSSENELRILDGHRDIVHSVSFSPDGSILASGASEKTIRLWEVSTGRGLRRLKGHENGVNSVTFSPDGRLLASGSWDRTIRL